MTNTKQAELIRLMRLDQIAERRELQTADQRYFKPDAPFSRSEWNAAKRTRSADFRSLRTTRAFHNLSSAYAAAYEGSLELGACELLLVISKVRTFAHLVRGDMGPQELQRLCEKQASAPQEHAATCRALASQLNPTLCAKLEAIASEIESEGVFSLKNVEIGGDFIDLTQVGRRGGASDNEGAFRGLLIRQTASLLEEAMGSHKELFATISGLLKWAGVPRVTPALVRSILLKGCT